MRCTFLTIQSALVLQWACGTSSEAFLKTLAYSTYVLKYKALLKVKFKLCIS